MAVRRFNYTGRKRIRQSDTSITVRESVDGTPEFDTNLALAEYELPANAVVSVEAYRQTSWMRFPCGTVADIQLPADRTLSEFDSAEGVLFRVRVTSVDEPEGLLLAEADRIRPRRPDEVQEKRVSLLPARPDGSLGDQVFRVDFSDHPLLLINSRVGDWHSVATDPGFVSMVLPAVLREILTRILWIEDYHETDDLSDWRAQWLTFAMRLPGVGGLPAQEEQDRIDDWIDEAATAFCRRFGIYGRFGQYWAGEVLS